MLVGMMNHPARRAEDEIAFAAEHGFEFVDLTLEPPDTWPPDVARLRRALDAAGLRAVGHTAWFVPHASAVAELRDAAHEVLCRAIDAFADLAVPLVNVHPDVRREPGVDDASLASRNAEALARLAEHAARRGVTLMVENVPGFGASAIAGVLDAVPALELHLDVGHANIGGEGQLAALLHAGRERLVHVHLSDNHGDEDRHLPLGAGSIGWADVAGELRRTGYDGTVTLEVFSSERRHRLSSADVARVVGGRRSRVAGMLGGASAGRPRSSDARALHVHRDGFLAFGGHEACCDERSTWGSWRM